MESWFSGSRPFSREVLGPPGELGPAPAGEVPIAEFLLHGGDEDEKVAAFFDGHLVFFGALAAAVDLTIGERVGAEVVGGEGPLPAREGGVFEDGFELGFEERGIEEEEEGRGGIEDVDGGDAAVGEVLFGEEHGGAVEVRSQAVGGEGLAIGEDGELGVGGAAGFFEVGGEVLIELCSPLVKFLNSCPAFPNMSSTVSPLRCQ